MATFRKRGDGWRAEIVRNIDGKRIRLSDTFPTKAHAQTWATEKEAELLGIRRTGLTNTIALPGQDGKTLQEAIERYQKEVSPTKKGAKWELLRLNAITRDYPQLAATQLPRLTPEHIAQWRDDRLKHVQGPSVSREMILLSSVLSHARREWRWLSANPMSDVKKPSNNKPRDARITENEATTIATAMGFTGKPPATLSAEVGLMFLLAIETAMRSGEIVALTWNHIFLKDRYLTISDSKNGDRRDVPLSAHAIELLKLMAGKNDPAVFSVTDASRDALFRKLKPVEFAHINFHDTRHEATTRLSKKLDVLSLARVTGHRDLKSLMIYYNESASDMAHRL